MTVHIVIPDTQVRPDVPVQHLSWIGEYVRELVRKHAGEKVRVVHLGDHHDMPSLSSHASVRELEGKRYIADIEAGNAAIDLLSAPFRRLAVDRHVLLGNHEDRITRAGLARPALEGFLKLSDLEWDVHGWKVYPFLKPVFLDGVGYAHYWYRPLSGRPYTGAIENRLRHVGHSFTQGHEQTLLYGIRHVSSNGGYVSQHGLVAGACYLHDETYKGPQGNAHWRGIIVCHEVSRGGYDPMFVSLNYLCRRYEGVALSTFARKVKGVSQDLR